MGDGMGESWALVEARAEACNATTMKAMARVIVDLKARVEDLSALVGRLQSDRYEGVDRQGILDRIVALERRADQATNGG